MASPPPLPAHAGSAAGPASSGNPGTVMLDPLDLGSTWLLPPELLDASPSRQDKVSAEEERKYRRRTVMFMETFQKQEDIDWRTLVTAQTFFHYFYAKHSFRRHPRFNVLVACLYLAGKVTECPKRAARDLAELVQRANRLWLRRPAVVDAKADLAADQLASLKRDVLSCERTLLHAIAFDLIVPNPQTFLMEKIKLAAFDTPTVPAALKKTFGEKTFYFLKFAMRTSLCLQFPPSYLAAAAVGLSAAYLGLPILLPGASGPVAGGPIEPLAVPPRPVGAQGARAAAGPPPLPLVVSGSPLLAGGSPAMAPGAYGGGDASNPGDLAQPAAAQHAAAAHAAAAHAVWQQVLGPVTGPEFASLAAQVLEAFKWSEGDAAAATPCATALEARLQALGVLSAAAARPGPGKAVKAPGVAAGPKKPRPPPPPPPPGAPPPPSSEPDSKRVKQ